MMDNRIISTEGMWIFRVHHDGSLEFNPKLTPVEGSEQAFELMLELVKEHNANLRKLEDN